MAERSKYSEWELTAGNELRLEVEDKPCHLLLLEGTAEVFGTELVQNKEVSLYPGTKAALYTWHGCKVKVSGNPGSCYLAKDTPMRRYLNVHMALEQQRQEAKAADIAGPKVMIVGLADVGKTTLSRILLNYSARLGNESIFVDLDVGQTSIGIPGSIGVLPVERPADISSGFSMRAPAVFHFGYKTPEGNKKLYCKMMESAAAVVDARCKATPAAKYGGVFINTCGWVDGAGYKLLRRATVAFKVDLIIILDNDLLYNKLQRDSPAIPDLPCKLLALPKSGGVVVRSRSVRAIARTSCIQNYFYGIARDLYPHTFNVFLDNVKIFKVGAPEVPDSLLPLGMTREDMACQLSPVRPSGDLIHSILAVSFAATADDLLTSNVCGFICVCEVNLEHRLMRVLSPQQEPLPSPYLLLSEVRYMDNG